MEIREIGLDEFIKTVAGRYGRLPHDVERICKGEVWDKNGKEILNPQPASFNMGSEFKYLISVDEIKKYFADQEARKDIKVRDEDAMEHFMKIDPAVAPPPAEVPSEESPTEKAPKGRK